MQLTPPLTTTTATPTPTTTAPVASVSTVSELLASPDPVSVPPDWWSWAGAHGGLVVALTAADARRSAPGLALRATTAQFLRPVRGPLETRSEVVRRGRSVTTVRTEGWVHGRLAVVTTSTLGPLLDGPRLLTEAGPDVDPPEGLPSFALPVESVPFGQHVEIRPVTDGRPLGGSPRAELHAWVRLVGDDEGAPDPLRTIVLADALAPSLLAAVTQPIPVPTVELSVHLSPTPRATDPDDAWVLLRARTDWADDGWVSEDVEVRGRSGGLIASTRQLRLATR